MRSRLLILVPALLAMGCHRDKPQAPPAVASYTLFMMCDDTTSVTSLFTYDLDNERFDSISIPLKAEYLFEASPDGENLFLTLTNSVVRYDIASSETTQVWPGWGWIWPSPDGRYLANLDWNVGISLLRSTTLERVFFDTVKLLPLKFTQDSKGLYGWGRDYVYWVRLDSGFTIRRYPMPGHTIWDMTPSPTDDRWVVIDAFQGGQIVQVYDPQSDSILFSLAQTAGRGTAVVSRDGRRAFFTNPGSAIDYGGPKGSYAIHALDMQTLQLLPEITSVGLYGTDSLDYKLFLTGLLLSPDGRLLVAYGRAGRFMVVNPRSLTVLRRVKAPDYRAGFARIVRTSRLLL